MKSKTNKQEKKKMNLPLGTSLEEQNKTGADNTQGNMPVKVDTHPANQKEIEKGCKCNSKTGEPCGIVGELKFNLCPSCQALLNYNQEVIKMIEELKEIYDRDFEATDLDTPYRVDMMMKEIRQKLKGDKE